MLTIVPIFRLGSQFPSLLLPGLSGERGAFGGRSTPTVGHRCVTLPPLRTPWAQLVPTWGPWQRDTTRNGGLEWRRPCTRYKRKLLRKSRRRTGKTQSTAASSKPSVRGLPRLLLKLEREGKIPAIKSVEPRSKNLPRKRGICTAT